MNPLSKKTSCPKEFGLRPPRAALGTNFDFSVKFRKQSIIYIFGSAELIFQPRIIIFEVVYNMISNHQKRKNVNISKIAIFFILES